MALAGFGLNDVQYLKRQKLIRMLHDQKIQKQKGKYIIIDVRDKDYVGGHIVGSVHIPQIEIEKHWPTIIDKYNIIPLIIFHCQYSEIRAPAAYQRYSFLLKSLIGLYTKTKAKKQKAPSASDLDTIIKFQSIEFTLNDSIVHNLSNQTHIVMDGGFYGFVCDALKNPQDLTLIEEFDKNMYCSQTYATNAIKPSNTKLNQTVE
eukprot:33946_1